MFSHLFGLWFGPLLLLFMVMAFGWMLSTAPALAAIAPALG